MTLQALYEEALGHHKRGNLFRQTAHDDWAGMFAQMQAKVAI